MRVGCAGIAQGRRPPPLRSQENSRQTPHTLVCAVCVRIGRRSTGQHMQDGSVRACARGRTPAHVLGRLTAMSLAFLSCGHDRRSHRHRVVMYSHQVVRSRSQPRLWRTLNAGQRMDCSIRQHSSSRISGRATYLLNSFRCTREARSTDRLMPQHTGLAFRARSQRVHTSDMPAHVSTFARHRLAAVVLV